MGRGSGSAYSKASKKEGRAMSIAVPASGSTVEYAAQVQDFLKASVIGPLFLCGSAIQVLRAFPDEVVDFCMTSPPYWGKRQYAGGGIGLEGDYREYIRSLLSVFAEVHRVLKPSGSFWLNIGDSYLNKRLLGLPWRVAFGMTDEQGWILRNDVVWNKVKGGPDNATDKLRNVHEPVFHFVKRASGYYYNADAIRTTPKKAKIVNGAIVSATGVSGVRYRRQIELSTVLTEAEKADAFAELDKMFDMIRLGKLADFRMIIRGQQRATHSDSEKVSGRAREIQQRGFYFLRYHPNGSKPGDVWDIIPEDTQNRDGHFAPYPTDLCRIPLAATCPESGIALDPFCGTGTTNLVAFQLGRKSIGIDISADYIAAATERCNFLL
jgi:DNA modification methylase